MAYVKDFGGPGAVEVGTVPDPVPGPDEVLVRVDAAGVGPCDLAVVSGAFGPQGGFPVVLGADVVGAVVAVADGVTDPAVGRALQALLLVLTDVAVGRIGRLAVQGDALATDGHLTELAVTARFRTADFAGQQTGYAFDIRRGDRASRDDVGQRKKFVASTAFRDDLRAVARARLDPSDWVLLTSVVGTFVLS